MEQKESRLLREIHEELAAEGYKPGTNAYDFALRARKVDVCKHMHGVASCYYCPAFDTCPLIKQHLRDVRFGKVDEDEKKRGD